MIDRPYKALCGTKERKSEVDGPGEGQMSFFPRAFSSWPNAVDAANCANEAYRVGYARAKADIRRALGIKE